MVFPPGMKESAAPWFYRKRFMVFGLIYGLAFLAGYAIVAFSGTSSLPVYRASGHPLIVGATALAAVVAGYAVRVWGSSYLSAGVMWADDPQTHALYVAGPYRFTRNPLYLGNVLQSIGIGLVTPWPVCVLIIIGIYMFDYALIEVEEPYLAATQGDAYKEYLKRVPRLFPIPGKSAPAPSGSGAPKPSLAEGFRAEVMTGLFAVVVFGIVLLVPHQ